MCSTAVALLLATGVTACGSGSGQDGSGIDDLGSEDGDETPPDPVGERIVGIGVGGGDDELTYSGIDSEEEEVWGPAAYVVDEKGLNWLADGPGYKILVIDDQGEIVDRYDLDGLVRGIEDIEVTATHVYVLAVGGVEPIIGRFGRNDVASSDWESFSIPTDEIDTTDITGLRKDTSGVVSLELTFGRQHLPLFSAAGEAIASPGAPSSTYSVAGHEVQLVDYEDGEDPTTAKLLVDGAEVATVSTVGTLGDFHMIDETPDGQIWIHVADVGIEAGALVTRSLAYRFSLDGEVVEILEMPMRNEVVWVEHRLAMTPEGDIRVLSTDPVEVTLRRPTVIGPVEARELPPGVSPYLPGKATIGAPPQANHNGEQCMHREDIMQRAYEYANFEATYNSNHMQTCAGRTPVSYFQQHLGVPIRGVAYKYAGHMEVSTYADAVANNYTVGDLNTKTDKNVDSCSYGVDCSGFVSKAWRSGHYSTGTLHNVSFELGSTDELQAGDALNKPFSHVRLVAEHLGGAGVKVVEATVGQDRMRVIVRDASWASAGYAAGYKPVRFNSLCADAPPPPLPPPSTHVIFDVTGYLPGGSAFTPITPARLLDTRALGGEKEGPLVTDEVISITIAGRGGIPDAAQLGGVVLNVTVATPEGDGFLSVYPDQPFPGTSNLNFTVDKATPALVFVDPGDDGKIEIQHVTTFGGSHVIVDAFGWFPNNSDLNLVTPARVFDSRQPQYGATMLSAGTTDLQFAGVGGIPLGNVAAVIANITAVLPVEDGYATVYEAGTPQPATSNLNFAAGTARSNLVIVPVSDQGLATLFSIADSHYIVDVFGWFAPGSDFSPISPIRLRDTRVDDLEPLGHEDTVTIDVDAAPTIPNGVEAVLGNLTAVSPTRYGYLQIYAEDPPVTSSVNFAPGDTVANAVISAVSAQSGEVHVTAIIPEP